MRTSAERTCVDPEIVRAALERVCSSPPLAASRKLTSFLRFVVEATLAGQGDRLKGYTIAVAALGRAESFDPQADPIVRVEATRLRRALRRYYQGEGANDPVVIELPTGSYRPRFHGRQRATIGAWAAARAVLRRLLAAEGAWLLPPDLSINLRSSDVRQEQQAEGAPAAGACRPGTG